MKRSTVDLEVKYVLKRIEKKDVHILTRSTMDLEIKYILKRTEKKGHIH